MLIKSTTNSKKRTKKKQPQKVSGWDGVTFHHSSPHGAVLSISG